MPCNFSQERLVRFGGAQVGDGQPCFIVYEAGPTHDGLESAKQLVDLASEAGAGAIKFQIFDPDRLVSDKSQLFSYEVLIDADSGKTETIEEPLYDIFVRRALSKQGWREIKKYCDRLNLMFFATVGFEDELSLLEDLNCESIKIASADVNHWPLIERAAKTGMCLQLDTGNATLGEVEEAVDIIRSTGNERIIIHQCPSNYPASVSSINLRLIETLRQMFPYPIAYSDHSPGADMDIAAISLGANLVEKTITMDRTTRSVEHMFSLAPSEMKSFVWRLRDVESAMGIGRRVMLAEEKEKRVMARRSVFLVEDAKKGTSISDLKIDYRRPGDGIAPDEWVKLKTGRLKADLASDTKLSLRDLDL